MLAPETIASHRWGKTGPGHKFHKIAVDLDRAWSVCQLTFYERRVLQYVREHTWGVSAPKGKDAEPCVVAAPRLALLWRVHRQRINDAVASLRRDGLLLHVSGRYLVGKDVASWKGDRITAADMDYAIRGDDPNRELEPAEPERKCVRPDTRIRPNGTRIRPNGTRIRVDRHTDPSDLDANPCRSTHRSVRLGRGSVSDAAATYRNAGASEDLETEEEKEEGKRDGRAKRVRLADQEWHYGLATPLVQADPGPASPKTAKVVGGGIVGPGRDSGEAVALRDWVISLKLGEGLAELAATFCDLFPAEWVRVVYRKKVVLGRNRSEAAWVAYLGKILESWAEAGECEYLVETRSGQPGGINLKSWTPDQRPEVEAAIATAISRNIMGSTFGGRGVIGA